ncbi:MAG TPA: dihydroorotase [Cyclobacteriaceae bacterium]|nr:dihydroorotase [Cyclobacteriaceae bacterium]
MKILIQSARIISKGSPFHLKTRNVLLNNGRIAEIGDKNYPADRVIDAEGMILSPGWVDIGASVGDPGHEQREDLQSLAKAAAAGGFTEVAVLPNTQPAVQTKNEIAYLTANNDNRLVQIHALAAVTKNCQGEELTEMIDLHHAGALAFTDGLRPVWHTDIFLKALQYLQKFEGLLIDHPEDNWLNLFGQMHEGAQSTMLGLKGMPRIAEEVAISKNLELLTYAGGRLHFSKLSTAKSIDLVRAAKKKGFQVTCDVAAYQPLYNDSVLVDFDTNYKVNPPLRERADQDALLKGLKDGTIDVLVSNHSPQDDESKFLEFDQAEFGLINFQTFASQITALAEEVDLADLIEKITDAPRRLLKLQPVIIDVDNRANLTLFDPNSEWIFSPDINFSKSKNSPWLAQKIKGRAVAVFNNTKQSIDV